MNQIVMPPKIQDDEHEILRRLDRPAPPNNRWAMAPFRLEVHLSRRRNLNKLFGRLLIWESAKKLDGDGDELMFWCGYADCQKPIRSTFLQEFHVECPFCSKTSFRSPDAKRTFVEMKGISPGQKADLEKHPSIYSEWGFQHIAPKALATKIVDEFVKLGRAADVLINFSPHDIRSHDVVQLNVGAHYDKAREARVKNKLVYPLERIQRDLSVPGVLLEKQIEKMLRA